MDSTGMVRRMDDLGRLVVPKKIRNAIGVKEGDPFEIFVDVENQTVSFRLINILNNNEKAEEN